MRALPDAEVALLRDTFDPADHDRLLADAAAIGARAVSAHQDAVTPAFIAAAAERGLAVYCWYQRLDVQRARLAEVGRGRARGRRHRLARRCPGTAAGGRVGCSACARSV